MGKSLAPFAPFTQIKLVSLRTRAVDALLQTLYLFGPSLFIYCKSSHHATILTIDLMLFVHQLSANVLPASIYASTIVICDGNQLQLI